MVELSLIELLNDALRFRVVSSLFGVDSIDFDCCAANLVPCLCEVVTVDVELLVLLLAGVSETLLFVRVMKIGGVSRSGSSMRCRLVDDSFVVLAGGASTA